MSSEASRVVSGFFLLILSIIIKISCPIFGDLIVDGVTQLKPFHSAYLQASSLTICLIVVIFSRRWSEFIWSILTAPCTWTQPSESHSYSALEQTECEEDKIVHEFEESVLSESTWLPISINCGDTSSEAISSENEKPDATKKARVRFSKLTEVKHLLGNHAEEAVFARMSYTTSMRMEERAARDAIRLEPLTVVGLAFKFALLWFGSIWSYEAAISKLKFESVQFISYSSALIVIPLSLVVPSSHQNDYQSLTKVLAILVSYYSLYTFTWNIETLSQMLELDSLYCLLSATLSAASIVLVRSYATHEDHLDVAVFLGFVGLTVCILTWPVFIVLHYTGVEQFVLFTNGALNVFLVNGLFATIIPQLLWLWGCILSSSLITASSGVFILPIHDMFNVLIESWTFPVYYYLSLASLIAVTFLLITITIHNYDVLLYCLCYVFGCHQRKTRTSQQFVAESETLLENETA
ncbi:Solute carrier family 35 member F5 [Halotydeus destructor]|nr:Solute carrier family 35 member F5 [Halotydeus destructor]